MGKLKVADLFCGGGGTSEGAESSGAAEVVCAVNHWKVAIQTHKANFPKAHHINTRVDQTPPGECPKMDILFASPECTNHSIARGDKPINDQSRATAWDVLKWIDHHRPPFVVIENVREFMWWGPCGANGRALKSGKGKTFNAWLAAIESCGYRVEYHLLNSADFGAATSRLRLIVIARKGRRSIPWPEPTHSKNATNTLPGMGLKPWRAAYEIIDWTLPCRSIFGRKRPLVDNTLQRLDLGLRKFVEPFIVKYSGQENGESLGSPVSTIRTSGAHHGLAIPYLFDVNHGGNDGSRVYGIDRTLKTLTTKRGVGMAFPFLTPNFGEREGQEPRTHSLVNPLPTATGAGAGNLVIPFVLGQQSGSSPRSTDLPIPTIATSGAISLTIPFLTSYYSQITAQSVDDPLDTVTTKDRHGLAMVQLIETMKGLGVADIFFRMLQNHELAAAMGFPADYIWHGKKGEITKQIGNAVHTQLAKHITLAIASV